MLIKMPGMVEAADMTPIYSLEAPRKSANKGKTGFLDIVEEKIAHAPMTLSSQK